VLTLANSVDNPSQTPLSHLEGRTILTETDAVDRVEGLQCVPVVVTLLQTHTVFVIIGSLVFKYFDKALFSVTRPRKSRCHSFAQVCDPAAGMSQVMPVDITRLDAGLQSTLPLTFGSLTTQSQKSLARARFQSVYQVYTAYQ
jgi:hypothetical protein